MIFKNENLERRLSLCGDGGLPSPLLFFPLLIFYPPFFLVSHPAGVPLVLNTSFNVFPGEPIVESPRDALRAFLGGRGSGKRIDRLVFLAACLQLKPAGCPLNLDPQGQLLDPGTPAPGAAAKGPAPTTDPAPAPAPAGKKARTGQVVPGRSAGARSKAKLAPQRQSLREGASSRIL